MTFIAFTVCCGLLAFSCGLVVAECPDHHHIDVKYNSSHYMGAYWYNSPSSRYAMQSCKGRLWKLEEGYQHVKEQGYSYGEHALVVRPGCVLYEFTDYNYQGDQTAFSAGVHPRVPEGFKSCNVRCDIAHFQCTPVDKFETVLTCDATAAVAETDCSYTKKIGTTINASLNQSISLGVNIGTEITTSFFSLFSATLGNSINTGYNWTSVSELTKSSPQSFQVKDLAPHGLISKIEQVIGRCGGSTVRTELFRISHYRRKTDNEVKLPHSFKDKTRSVNPKLALYKKRGKVGHPQN